MEVVRAGLTPEPASFFPQDRLWSRPGLLAPELCTELVQEASLCARRPQSLISPETERHYDPQVRKTRQALVSRQSQARVTRELMSLRHGLTAHFGIPLTACQPPQFLVYEPGDFFLAHSDVPEDSDKIRHRRLLTAVIFLNRPDDPVWGYTGGELMLYAFENAGGVPQGYPLAPQAGQLAVFPAGLIHEVLPVLSGVRYTIISWYY